MNCFIPISGEVYSVFHGAMMYLKACRPQTGLTVFYILGFQNRISLVSCEKLIIFATIFTVNTKLHVYGLDDTDD